MKLMRIVRNANAFSTFMRNAGFKKRTIAAVNMVIFGILTLASFAFILTLISTQ